MDKQNGVAQLRHLEEVGLRRSGVETMPPEERHLPVKWNGSHLCRVSGSGSVLHREADIERHRAQGHIAGRDPYRQGDFGEYLAMLEHAPQRKASGLVGDDRILANFGAECQKQKICKPLLTL